MELWDARNPRRMRSQFRVLKAHSGGSSSTCSDNKYPCLRCLPVKKKQSVLFTVILIAKMAPFWSSPLSCFVLFVALANALPGGKNPPSKDLPVVKQTTCGKHTYQYHGLSGYGTIPSDAVDKYGDTLGGLGSAVAIEQSSWKRKRDGSYEGIAWALPDRGWYEPLEESLSIRSCETYMNL